MDSQDLDLIEELASAAPSKARTRRPDVNFDAEGVLWLDSYLEQLRASGSDELSEEEIGQLGAFLGKCILARYGGEWCFSDQGTAVRLPDGTTAFPMSRVRRQLAEGQGASVRALYAALDAIRSR